MNEKEKIKITDIINIVDLCCKDENSRKKWRDELISDLSKYYHKSAHFIDKIIDVEIPFSYADSDLIVQGQVDLVIENKKKEIEIIEYCCSLPRKIAVKKQLELKASFIWQQGDLTITNEGRNLERSEGNSGNCYAILNISCTSGIYTFTFAVELDDGASTVIGIAGEQLGVKLKKDSKIFLERCMSMCILVI